MCINAAQEIFYMFGEFIIFYMSGINLHFPHLIIWHLFQFLCIQAEVHENLRHLLFKLLALMEFTNYAQVSQKQMRAGGSQRNYIFVTVFLYPLFHT